MGSIVKSIGKAIKGIGKALKKIAPILLMAAAIYLGYGYMTGFQSGGWPKIIGWGKSLMSGVSQGQTISQAATAATDIGAVAGAETAALGAADVTATALRSSTRSHYGDAHWGRRSHGCRWCRRDDGRRCRSGWL